MCDETNDDEFLQKKNTTCTNCGHKFRFSLLEDRIEWEEKDNKCPSCKISYCNKPETERNLFLLQDILLSDKNNNELFQSTIVKMYNILIEYSRSLILKHYPTYLNYEDEAIDYASRVTWLLLEQYYDISKNFRIFRSFASYLKKGKLQEAFQHKDEKVQDDCSINDETESYLTTEIPDDRNIFSYIEREDERRYIHNYVSTIISVSSTFCNNRSENFMRLVGLEAFLSKGELASDRIFKFCGRDGKWSFMKTLEVMKNELFNIEY